MTSEVNMINLQVIAVDQIALDQSIVDKATGKTLYEQNIAGNSKFYSWQSDFQTIPLGMDGKPEQFAQKLRESLPEVNNLRLLFNENSFDKNGEFHEQYKAFLEESVKQGFEITFVYGGGDAQNIGNGGSAWGHESLTNAQAYAALEENFTDVQGAWDALLDWLDGAPGVQAGVYGYELMNEAAGYRRSIKENGTGDGYDYADFVKLYADHAIELSDTIQARADAKVLVGGWGYSGDFATLENTVLNDKTGQSALDYIRDGVGDALVWSAHLYPGWVGTNDAISTKDLTQILKDHFSVIAQDDVLITETNAHGLVDNIIGGEDITDFFVTMYEWFADNDIGIGWFPGAETGGANFVVIDQNGSLRFLHQHSYAHGMNAFSLGDRDAALSGDDRIDVTLIEGRLRNETYESDYNDGAFDTEELLGTAFAFEGDDTLVGTSLSNDFAYGGYGNDRLLGKGGDDFLFGQQDNDVLIVTSGVNHLYGGSGNDRLVGGKSYDQMHGGKGNDVFVTDGKGQDVVTDFSFKQDMVDLQGVYADWAEISENLTRVDGDADGVRDDVEVSLGGRASLTLLNVKLSALSAQSFVGARPEDGKISGTVSADLIGAGAYEDAQGEGVSNGADRVFGLSGDDTVYGYKGNDVIFGGQGDDILFGGGGKDKLKGAQGADQLVGNNGADILLGGGGRDDLSGGQGDDVLQGNKGKDILTGGEGQDSFVFKTGDGVDVVTDFNLSQDELHFLDAQDYSIKETASGTMISYDTKDKVLLDGVFAITDGDLTSLELAIVMDGA